MDGSTVKKNLLLGLSVFLIISGIWAGIISEKYGMVTIGTTGSYNYALVGPESNGHLMFYQGLIEPPNEFSVSSWEDPSYFQITKWNPIGSSHNFIHQITIIFNNICQIILISLYLLFVPLFVILLAFFLLLKSNKSSIKNNLIFILGTVILYTGGYVIIMIEERYLWFVIILTFILGFYALNIIYNDNYIKKNLYKSLFAILIISAAFYPIISLSNYAGASSGFYETSVDLKSHGINGNIASSAQWEIMDYYSYYLDGKYYGITKNQTDVELKQTLVSNNIDYYFVWGDSSSKDFLGENVYETRYFKVFKIK